MAVVLQNLYESKGTSFTSALAVSRQSSTSQKADPEFVLKPIAEGLLHNIDWWSQMARAKSTTTPRPGQPFGQRPTRLGNRTSKL